MRHTDEPIVVEETFLVSKKILWAAITEHNQMIQWFFEVIKAFEPTIGFETQFIIEHGGRIFPHLWKIIHVEPYKKISYNWKYEGYVGDSEVSFEISEFKDKSKLKVTHQVLESFPQDIPEFQRESCLGGWNYFIKQRLKNYLNNQ